MVICYEKSFHLSDEDHCHGERLPMRITNKNLSRSRRRRSERLAIVLPVSIYAPGRGDSKPVQAVTRDISKSGVSYEADRRHPLGTKLLLSFAKDGNQSKRLHQISAQVVRVSKLPRGNTFLVGARFTDSVQASGELAELLRHQMRISKALLQIVNALSPTAEMKAIVEKISRATAMALEAQEAFLFLPLNERGIFSAGVDRTGRKLRIVTGRGLLGQAASSGTTMNLVSPSQHPLFALDSDRPINSSTRSVLCTPLRGATRSVSGLLLVLNKLHGPFAREDEDLALAIANQVSAVLREASLMERINNIKRFNERILETVASAIITVDKYGRLTSANRAAAEIFGFHPSKDAGKGIYELLDRTTNPRLCGILEDTLRDRRRQTAYDARLLRRDKANYGINLTAVPMKSSKGSFSGVVLVAEDITKEQRFITTMSRYLAREVAEQMFHSKKWGKLGGTKTDVTILIADIRNFTRLSEKMDPMDVMDLLNVYFSPMINVIFRHQGMVDKFMGDAILAVFGVPVRKDDDSLRAVHAAIEMRRELSELNTAMIHRRGIALEIGIGITSGIVISGNLGSERRMDFTVIGDPVNLASRLEGLTKKVQRRILISENVQRAVKDVVPCEFLGRFRIRGKSQRVPTYAVQNT